MHGEVDVNDATKIGGYVAALAVVFLAALGIGNAVGPIGQTAEPTQSPTQTETGHGGMDMDEHTGG